MKRSWEATAILGIAVSASIAAPGSSGSTAPAAAEQELPSGWKSGFVSSSEGVKIHYLEAGPGTAAGDTQLSPGAAPGLSAGGSISATRMRPSPSIVFVPGWVMPAWIWDKQIRYFSRYRQAVASGPRWKGESSQTSDGLFPPARARDIKALVDQLRLAPVVLAAWSMALAEAAA